MLVFRMYELIRALQLLPFLAESSERRELAVLSRSRLKLSIPSTLFDESAPFSLGIIDSLRDRRLGLIDTSWVSREVTV